MNPKTIQPVKDRPGVFVNTISGELYDISEMREGDKYDTVILATGPVVAGTELWLFRDVAQKRTVDTNFTQQSRLSAGEKMLLTKIGAMIPLAFGDILPTPSDIKKVAENCTLRVEVNSLLQAEGKLIFFQSGFGLAGMTQETDQGIVSIGVPSTASAAKLARPQDLTSQHDVLGKIRFDDRNWAAGFVVDPDDLIPKLDHPVAIVAVLHGLIKSAVSK
jgi:hypothetical protein